MNSPKTEKELWEELSRYYFSLIPSLSKKAFEDKDEEYRIWKEKTMKYFGIAIEIEGMARRLGVDV